MLYMRVGQQCVLSEFYENSNKPSNNFRNEEKSSTQHQTTYQNHISDVLVGQTGGGGGGGGLYVIVVKHLLVLDVEEKIHCDPE